jgi:hypothetical protein
MNWHECCASKPPVVAWRKTPCYQASITKPLARSTRNPKFEDVARKCCVRGQRNNSFIANNSLISLGLGMTNPVKPRCQHALVKRCATGPCLVCGFVGLSGLAFVDRQGMAQRDGFCCPAVTIWQSVTSSLGCRIGSIFQRVLNVSLRQNWFLHIALCRCQRIGTYVAKRLGRRNRSGVGHGQPGRTPPARLVSFRYGP